MEELGKQLSETQQLRDEFWLAALQQHLCGIGTMHLAYMLLTGTEAL